ncbi:hypothetical protein GCM10011514_41080 [Emticicia aquatilis]|uniref:DUF4145 domain-containing protein n=1 Tax=Emticicia aquatilis TaxID=1537369 RepID=A0A916Z2F0_9BACT|nr:DUF4145 domain-containing protein [Emticicia aquatilis]GGD72777.1 hypothetical protein GCM10011514_41080 [Emticicia aquatilis]
MKLNDFLVLAGANQKSEIEKVSLLCFYRTVIEDKEEFEVTEICNLLNSVGFAKPNPSRLRQKLIESKLFVKSSLLGSHKLHSKELERLKKEHPHLSKKSEDIISSDIILPEILYSGTRGYIEKIAKQINASYENNIFDGCAVLMRRLIEILIIHVYENLGRINEIKDSNGYKNLSSIINYTISNHVVKNMSKITEETLDEFRELGNFSAHQIKYNAKRGDIERVRLKFRLAVEELLYASNIIS